MINPNNSITRMRIRELMDVRLRSDIDPMLMPGICWLLQHGFPMPKTKMSRTGSYCESKRAFTSQGRQCWVEVTGRRPRKNVRWSATVHVYGTKQEQDLAASIEPFHSISADMAVGVQIARLDEALATYDKENQNQGEDNDC